jgi:hypothetical protein
MSKLCLSSVGALGPLVSKPLGRADRLAPLWTAHLEADGLLLSRQPDWDFLAAACRGFAGPRRLGDLLAAADGGGFGCAGLRDPAKRAMMREVSGRLADYTVVAAEDPRSEELAGIMAGTAAACAAAGQGECFDLAAGPAAGRGFVRVPDRQRAILRALRAGDAVTVCGKGHEQSICFGNQEHPWSDREAVRWALGARGAAAPAEPPHVLPTWAS